MFPIRVILLCVWYHEVEHMFCSYKKIFIAKVYCIALCRTNAKAVYGTFLKSLLKHKNLFFELKSNKKHSMNAMSQIRGVFRL